MGSINNAEEARNICNLFKQLGDYKDSPQKVEELILLEQDLKKKEQSSQTIADTASSPDDLTITQNRITTTNRRALNVFLDNPYRTLGISRNATMDEAQSILDKFKKLERLKALSSYAVPYHLKHFEKPDRSAAVVQAAIGTLSDIKNRLFWFSTSIGCAAWYTTEYRELKGEPAGIDFDKYDVFLANYLFSVLTDPQFEDKSLWETVFHAMIEFVKSDSSDLTAYFAGADTATDFLPLFEKTISQPILNLIEDSEFNGLKHLYEILKNLNGMETLKEISKKLDSSLSDWFKAKTRDIDKEILELGEGKNASREKVKHAKKLYADLKTNIKPELTWAEQWYPDKSVRLTMFQDEYRGTAWSLMGFLFDAGAKDNARNIANDIERYCNDEQKNILKHVIREVPLPPEHEHYDLGYVSIRGGRSKTVYVTLSSSANLPPQFMKYVLIQMNVNVYLMNDANFNNYMNCQAFSYHRATAVGLFNYSIRIPSSGHWHIVVDNGSVGLCGVCSSASISDSY